jgi:protein TonB
MRKVRATRRASGAGRGTVVVGFTIARDGSLAGVQVLRSSGNAALDRIAADHIRRSAPFPPPPEGAGRSYSFEFVGR